MVVFSIKFLLTMKSPIIPKMKPNIALAKYGSAETNPVWPKVKPNTVDIKLGPAVKRKNKPHKFPKCNITNAQKGTDFAIFK